MKSNKKILRVISIAMSLLLMATVLPIGNLFAGWQLGVSAASTSDAIQSPFHDQAIYFMSNDEPVAGETLTLRVRALKGNLSSANLHYYTVNKSAWTTVAMSKGSSYDSTGLFEYWEASFTVPSSTLYYLFELKNSRETKYYSLKGSGYALGATASSRPSYDKGWYIQPGFETPDWAKGASWYAIMPDAFFNGDTTNDDESGNNTNRPWNLGHDNLNDRYGGDLQGVMNKMGFIESLGVDGVYFHPLHKASQNAGYGTEDFDQIESTFGNGQFYSTLIDTIHSKGMRVMQDVVTAFTPTGSKYWSNGGIWPETGGMSGSYASMFKTADMGDGNVSAWSGIRFNLYDPLSKQIIFGEGNGIARYADASLGFGVDGFRFDTGGDLWGYDTATNTEIFANQIIASIRPSLKQINPDLVLLSEWTGNEGYYGTNAYDARWDGWLCDVLKNYIGGSYTSSNLCDNFHANSTLLPRNVALCNHIQVNNHDKSGTTKTAENANRWRSAHLIQMTYVGSPFTYYGDVTNYSNNTWDASGFNSFQWDETDWDMDTLNFYKACFELRDKHPVLRQGAFIDLVNSTNVYAFGRFNGTDSVVTLANNATSAKSATVNFTLAGIPVGTVLTEWFTGQTLTVSSTSQSVSVPVGGAVYVMDGSVTTHPSDYEVTEVSSVSSGYGISLNGVDKTAEYQQNGSIAIPDGGSVVLSGLTFDADAKVTVTADFTYTSAAAGTNSDHVVGAAFGTCVYDGATYKMGVALRPDLWANGAAGSQFNLALVKGTGDKNSVWEKVWGGPKADRGTSNTTKITLEYDNGNVKAIANDSITVGTVDFTKYGGKRQFILYNYSLPCTVSNISVTGDYTTETTPITLSGSTFSVPASNGSLTGTADSLVFLNKNAYGNFTYQGSVNGNGAIMIRNSEDANAMTYAACLQGTTLTVMARTTTGGAMQTIATKTGVAANSSIRVMRAGSNCFTTYINNTLLSSSSVYIGMGDTVKVGVGSLGSAFSVSNLTLTENARTLADDFSGSVVSSLFDTTASISGGKLILTAKEALARTEKGDWSFKAKVAFAPSADGDRAGVIARQDDDQAIFAGRANVGGTFCLVFGKELGGNLAVLYTVPDTEPGSDVTVQLQRVGADYMAVYTYNETVWHAIGDAITMNMSSVRAGVSAVGTTTASVDYACFGNAMTESGSINTPISPDFEGVDGVANYRSGTYALRYKTGSWSYDLEGFKQSSTSGTALMVDEARTRKNFRAEATLRVDSGAGYVGMNFGRTNTSSTTTNGYYVKLSDAGVLTLAKGATVVATATPSAYEDGAVRVVLECIDNLITVYAGETITPVMQYEDTAYSGGYFGFVSSGVIARVCNYNIQDINSIGSVSKNVKYGKRSGMASADVAWMYWTKAAVTDYVVTAYLELEAIDTGAAYSAGLVLGGTLGLNESQTDGYLLKLNSNNTLTLSKNGSVLKTANLAAGTKEIKVMVAHQNKTYHVFLNGSSTAAFTYTESVAKGGAIGIVSKNSYTYFSEVEIEDLTNGTAYASCDLATKWFAGESVATSEPYIEKFDVASAAENYNNRYKVSGGTYIIDNDTNWDLRSGYMENTYKDFALNVRVRRKSTVNGWFGIGFRQYTPNDYLYSGGITLMIYGSSMKLYRAGKDGASASVVELASTSFTTANGTWYNIGIICQGNSIKVYVNGTQRLTATDNVNKNVDGYISFRSAVTNCVFDDLSVVSLDYAPEKPAVVTATDTSVQLESKTGFEYRMDGGSWQTVALFSGLTPNSTHTFEQRVAPLTSVYETPVVSPVLTLTTSKVVPATPNAPTIASITKDSVTLNAIAGYEYRIEGGEWQTSNVFTGLSTSTTYRFYQRVAETTTAAASAESASVTATTKSNTLIGDVDGKGSVNSRDRMILTRYLSHWAGYDVMVDMAAADIDGSKTVNSRDRMILTRYLSHWVGYDQYFA